MGKLGFRDNGSPYVYEEITGTSSAAIGLDNGDSGKLKVVVSLNPNATPGGTPLQMTIDPAANGNIEFTPNGSGNVVVGNGSLVVSAGNVTVPASNSSGNAGFFVLNSNVFLSNLGTGNVFVGPSVANLTLDQTQAQFNALMGTNIGTGITTAADNVSVGAFSMQDLTNGVQNVAVGLGCLQHIASGAFNIGIGTGTGNLMTAGSESSNILIGNRGVNSESNAIRIGVSGSGNQQQNACYIAGIFGATPAGGSEMVVIDTNGFLATQTIPVGGITTLDGDTGSATGSTVTIAGGSNITTSATGSTLTVDLDSTVSITGSMTAGSGLISNGNGVQVNSGQIQFPATTAGLGDGSIFLNGSSFMHAYGTHNTFLGSVAGNGALTAGVANDNTGIGFAALLGISDGLRNTAVGSGALTLADVNSSNTAVGFQALNQANTAAEQNVAVGFQAVNALAASGTNNVGIGYRALFSVATGSSNIALGSSAGVNLDTSDSSNIMIGNSGTSGDNHKIIIGTTGSGTGQQNFTQIAGIYGVTPGGGGLNMATIDSTGRLGSQALPSGSISITGDSGGALTGSSFTFTGGSTGLTFSGSGSTETLTGTLAIANGGTNATSMANTDGVVYYDGTRLVTTAVGSATQVLTSNGAGVAPTFQAVPSSGGMTWSEQTGTTQAMAVAHGYILNNAGVVTATLPATAAVGDIMAIVGKGAGGWLMAQNSGQTVHFGSVNTTTGAGGSLASTNRYDSLEIICTTANTDFVVRSSIGNLTVV